jgi:hypothetical protein
LATCRPLDAKRPFQAMASSGQGDMEVSTSKGSAPASAHRSAPLGETALSHKARRPMYVSTSAVFGIFGESHLYHGKWPMRVGNL